MDLNDAFEIERQLERIHAELGLVMHGIASIRVYYKMWRPFVQNKFKEAGIDFNFTDDGFLMHCYANDLCKLLKDGCKG